MRKPLLQTMSGRDMRSSVVDHLNQRLTTLIPTLTCSHTRSFEKYREYPEFSEGSERHLFALSHNERSVTMQWQPDFGLSGYSVSKAADPVPDLPYLTLDQAIEEAYYLLCQTTRQQVQDELSQIFFPDSTYSAETIQTRLRMWFNLENKFPDGLVGLFCWLKRPLGGDEELTPATLLANNDIKHFTMFASIQLTGMLRKRGST